MVDITDIKSLDEQIRPLLTQEELTRYSELTRELLRAYVKYPRKVNFMVKKKDPEKEQLINDYIMRTLMVFRENTSPYAQTLRDSMFTYITNIKRKESVVSENKCNECSSENISLDGDSGNIICLTCGFEMLDLSDRNIAYRDAETMTVIRKPIYERTKHFKELVNQYQGKLTHSIDPSIIENLRNCFRVNGIDPRTVTRRNICTFLQEIGHSELYDSVNYLYSHFTGATLPDLSGVEEQLYRDYNLLQKTYNELTPEEKQDRNNFLKGIHVFECLLKKNHIRYDPDAFPCLKTEDRLRKYEDIIEKLFKKLEWSKN